MDELKKEIEVVVIEVNDKNRKELVELVLLSYADDVCMYCHHKFTPTELKTSKWAHPNKFGRIVHGECWTANNK